MAIAHAFVIIPCSEDEGGYVAIFPDLPGCMTQGETLHDVVTAVNDAYPLWCETADDMGREIPAPYSSEDWRKWGVTPGKLDR